MNKYGWLALTSFMLIFLTYLVDATTLVTEGAVGGGVLDDPTAVSSSVSVWSMIGTWWDMMWFRIEGIPPIVNLLAFWPLSMVMMLIVAGIVKDIIPFT